MSNEPPSERARTVGPASPASSGQRPAGAVVTPPPQLQVSEGGDPGIADGQPSRPVARPRLGDGVELVGAITGSGFSEQQWLIARDEQFVQVSELLYRVAEQADGRRSLDEMAAAVTEVMPYAVTAEHIRRIVDTKLDPLGLVTIDGDSTPQQQRDPESGPLRVTGRIATVGPRVLGPVTGVLQELYRPWVVVPLLGAILAAHAWVYLGPGMGSALVGVIEQPLLVVPLFGIIVLAGIFHELGHAAALRYGGGQCRTMGFGFYLIYPALYTDTSDAYRLDRGARIRTDLGGFYFHQVFSLGLLALWVVTGLPIWLLPILIIDLEMLRQLLFPFVRFDGYWLLADLTGIPDLYTHLGAVLRRRTKGSSSGGTPVLRPWPRRVFTVYAAVAVPVLAGLLLVFVTRAPGFLRLMWASWQRQADIAVEAVQAGNLLVSVLSILEVLILTLPLIGGAFLVFNLARQVRKLPARVNRSTRSA